MNAPFQTKSFKAGPVSDNEVEGMASAYGNIDHAGDIVERGAYKRTLDRFNASTKSMPFLAHHRHDKPIGRIIELRDSDEGLYFKARFSDSHDGQNVRSQFLDGTLDSFSIGYRVLQKQSDRVNDRKVLRLKEIALHEISAVTFPCNELAKLTAVKGDIASSYLRWCWKTGQEAKLSRTRGMDDNEDDAEAVYGRVQGQGCAGGDPG